MTRSEKLSDTAQDAYRTWTAINLRYGDTDRQGHINNAVFCTIFESGRVSFLFDDDECIAGPGKAFVIAKLTIDFLHEMNFPGVAEVGSKIISIGRSSFTVAQAIFKDGKCCATSQSIIVMTDESTRKSSPLTEAVLHKLRQLT
ncbi:MAG TPA: thioesterase family protein [Candidatus Obscuribacterales bacterium]